MVRLPPLIRAQGFDQSGSFGCVENYEEYPADPLFRGPQIEHEALFPIQIGVTEPRNQTQLLGDLTPTDRFSLQPAVEQDDTPHHCSPISTGACKQVSCFHELPGLALALWCCVLLGAFFRVLLRMAFFP